MGVRSKRWGKCKRCERDQPLLEDGLCSNCRGHVKKGRLKRGTPEFTARFSGSGNNGWKGGRHVDAMGYVWLRIGTGDPIGQEMLTSRSKRYVQEHRLVMARFIGRPLDRSETVHHRNGTKADNRLENLKLFSSSSEHARQVHYAVCPHCGHSLR